jgi:hypothetical protein
VFLGVLAGLKQVEDQITWQRYFCHRSVIGLLVELGAQKVSKSPQKRIVRISTDLFSVMTGVDKFQIQRTMLSMKSS